MTLQRVQVDENTLYGKYITETLIVQFDRLCERFSYHKNYDYLHAQVLATIKVYLDDNDENLWDALEYTAELPAVTERVFSILKKRQTWLDAALSHWSNTDPHMQELYKERNLREDDAWMQMIEAAERARKK